jgi:hypothetical protein
VIGVRDGEQELDFIINSESLQNQISSRTQSLNVLLSAVEGIVTDSLPLPCGLLLC